LFRDIERWGKGEMVEPEGEEVEDWGAEVGEVDGGCAGSESALAPGCLEELVAGHFVEAAVFC
jgi:hypothetical protein